MAMVNFMLSALAALTSLACTVFLLRAYATSALRLLLWSGLCFVCLTVSNVLLFFDLVIFPEIDLRPYRLLAALVGILFLLYGFIWEAE
ncbi:MAG TPA: DUF5985 family protein [Burkholderiales bacterium]|nr:DUF5985 family protein [Burkholderiales bacterium]